MTARNWLLACAMLLAAACAPRASDVASRATVAEIPAALPEARRFEGPPRLAVPLPSNAQLSRDILALTFRLETGRALPVLTRYEGPITVAVEGAAPATLQADLDALLDRLRREAGIDIRRAAPGERGAITVAALPRAELQRQVPGAACFVVPRVSGWADYLANRRGPATDWTTLTVRTRASVFLPSDVSAQEIRDCLHEEVAQALGPLNDLYRLPHSVFNDDNVHAVLTRFDMLVLRAIYDPALRSGMTEAEVAARLPTILARIDPAGRGGGGGAVPESPRDWIDAIDGALTPRGSDRARLAAAGRAVAIAEAAGWTDERAAFALLTQGRAAIGRDGDLATASLLAAMERYRARPGTDLQRANVALHLGAITLSAGRPEAALRLLDPAIAAADAGQNAALLSMLLMLRAEATAAQGAPAEAARIRREAFAWGRYAWGDRVLARRAAEVASLGPGA